MLARDPDAGVAVKQRYCRLSCALAVAATFSAFGAQAQEDRFVAEPEERTERDRDDAGLLVPDFAHLQTGGYHGHVNAGLGYAFLDDILNVGIAYGYARADILESDIHTLDLRIQVRPLELGFGDFRLVAPNLTVGGIYVFGEEFETTYPERYRRIDPQYYPPSALHWTVRLGAEFDYIPGGTSIERHGLYYAFVTIDAYATAYWNNSTALNLTDIVAGELGYRVAFF